MATKPCWSVTFINTPVKTNLFLLSADLQIYIWATSASQEMDRSGAATDGHLPEPELLMSMPYGYAVAAVSAVAFQLIHMAVSQMITNPAGCRTELDRWKMKNIAVSWIHSTVIGIASAYGSVTVVLLPEDNAAEVIWFKIQSSKIGEDGVKSRLSEDWIRVSLVDMYSALNGVLVEVTAVWTNWPRSWSQFWGTQWLGIWLGARWSRASNKQFTFSKPPLVCVLQPFWSNVRQITCVFWCIDVARRLYSHRLCLMFTLAVGIQVVNSYLCFNWRSKFVLSYSEASCCPNVAHLYRTSRKNNWLTK